MANRSRLVKSQLRDEAATRHGCEEKSSKDLFPSKKKCCAGPFSLKYTGKNSFSYSTFVFVSPWGRRAVVPMSTRCRNRLSGLAVPDTTRRPTCEDVRHVRQFCFVRSRVAVNKPGMTAVLGFRLNPQASHLSISP